MHRSKLTSGLVALGLTGLLAADASVARADGQKSHHARETIQIQPDRQDLDQTARTRLDEMATWLKADSSRVIHLQADPATDPSMAQHATTVTERTKAYLKAAGVRESQIRIVPADQTATMGANQRQLVIVLVPTEGALSGQAGMEGEAELEGDAELGAGVGAEVEVGDAEVGAGVGAGVEAGEGGIGAQAGVQGDLDVDEPDYEPAPVYQQQTTYVEPQPVEEERDRPMFTPIGVGIAVGGGVQGFVDSDTTGFTDPGGSWEARLTVGTRTPLAFEAAYVGSAQNIEALGLDEDAFLLGTAFEGAARVNILRDLPVQPYLFGGLGYTRYSIRNESFNTSSIEGSENMGHVPVGAGIGFRAAGLMVDLRGTFRAAFNDDMLGENLDDDVGDVVPDPDDTRAELDSWNLAAKIGWEF